MASIVVGTGTRFLSFGKVSQISTSLFNRSRNPRSLFIRAYHRNPPLRTLPLFSAALRLPRPLLWLRSSAPVSFMATQAESGSPHQSDSSKTVRMVIKGRVQGVCYRNWTVENAEQLGLKGWVRNRRDGSVEALFSGPPETVDEMHQRCRRGPPAAMVTGLEAFPSTEQPGAGFEYRSTV
ncbi:PREDICTED: uncharacterized protein LOC104708793 [Camelina sativa]|uniref:acylphosphatase n=1 Tax=Camelina sativa TaxID=90675 RepID=A0ABM0TBH5_CAMSA|nr:PREDICTED: uncharacterized protein LOC104708793 [Camelina sativa]